MAKTIKHQRLTRQQVLDQYFLGARHRLVEIGAFLDRVQRAGGADDFRLKAFRRAMTVLRGRQPDRAKRVLLAFTDPTVAPAPKAEGKSACGAWAGRKSGKAA